MLSIIDLADQIYQSLFPSLYRMLSWLVHLLLKKPKPHQRQRTLIYLTSRRGKSLRRRRLRWTSRPLRKSSEVRVKKRAKMACPSMLRKTWAMILLLWMMEPLLLVVSIPERNLGSGVSGITSILRLVKESDYGFGITLRGCRITATGPLLYRPPRR
jgi:hypothetical protein